MCQCDLLISFLQSLCEFLWLRKCLIWSMAPRVLEVFLVIEPPGINLLLSVFFEPLKSLALLPKTVFDRLVQGEGVDAEAMLLAHVPVALILSGVLPAVGAKAMLLVIHVLPDVRAAIAPVILSDALHIVVEPLTLVTSPINPCVLTDATDLIILPLSCES